MPTYKSIVNYTGDGVTTRWSINFDGGYIDPSHIRVIRDATDTAAVLDGPGTVVIDPAVANGSTFKIQRVTPLSNPLVDFEDGAGITEQNLDIIARQALMVAAEAFDRTVEYTNQVSGGDFSAAISAAAAAAASVAASSAVAAATAEIAYEVEAAVAAATAGIVSLTPDGTVTFTNKTLNLSNNVLVGTVAQFNSALSDGDFVTLSGSETLTNKALVGGSSNATTHYSGVVYNGSLLLTEFQSGNINATCVVTDTGTVSPASPGFRSAPSVTLTGTPSFVLTSAGKCLSINANATIPANATLAYPKDTAIMLYNRTGSPITVEVAGGDVLRMAGTGTTGTRTLAGYGLATIYKTDTTEWLIAGIGLT